ncbi:MAG: hypothetical protein WAW31_00175 [Smithella sp.]
MPTAATIRNRKMNGGGSEFTPLLSPHTNPTNPTAPRIAMMISGNITTFGR